MHIGLDARKYYDFGIGTYIQNLLFQYDRLLRQPLSVFVAPRDRESIQGRHRCSVHDSSAGKYSIRELYSLSRQASRLGIDLFHAPHYTLPLGLRAKRVVTIHDIIHIAFPEYFNVLQRSYAAWALRHACSAADAVIVDAQFTKDELLHRFDVDPAKIHVVHLGVSDSFGPAGAKDEAEMFRRNYGIPSAFVLYVGSLKPHKNIPNLFSAMSQLTVSRDLSLVLVGEKMDGYPELVHLARRLGLEKRVITTGQLSASDLATAYRAASIVVLPSLYEGFGLPLLEAMASGTPVIGSRAASIPEVMGEAGLYADASRPEELALTIDRIMGDSSLRESLRKKGLEQASRFSWERCAKATIQIYEGVY